MSLYFLSGTAAIKMFPNSKVSKFHLIVMPPFSLVCLNMGSLNRYSRTVVRKIIAFFKIPIFFRISRFLMWPGGIFFGTLCTFKLAVLMQATTPNNWSGISWTTFLHTYCQNHNSTTTSTSTVIGFDMKMTLQTTSPTSQTQQEPQLEHFFYHAA